MSVMIEKLKEGQADEYEYLLSSVETSLLYSSFKYRCFLLRILDNSEPIYLVAREGEHLIGGLPLFIRYNARYGNILNSLPFYGSNGGIIVSSRATDQQSVKQALLDAHHELAVEKDVLISTLITNPLEDGVEFYEKNFKHTLRDERIGQITFLPTGCRPGVELQEKLMGLFHPKTRNSIRKAQRSGLEVYHSDSLSHFQCLANMHRQNIEAIGGLAKPWSIFKAIRDTFTYDQDYQVYIAQKDGQVMAALLVFYFNKTAEYYTPATLEAYRVYQPMSLLVYEAMQEAVRRGCKHWNWGGTWLTQSGVYHFKSRWGTKDIRYFYYIREYGQPNPLRSLATQKLLEEFPYFYVLPFQVLQKGKDEAKGVEMIEKGIEFYQSSGDKGASHGREKIKGSS